MKTLTHLMTIAFLMVLTSACGEPADDPVDPNRGAWCDEDPWLDKNAPGYCDREEWKRLETEAHNQAEEMNRNRVDPLPEDVATGDFPEYCDEVEHYETLDADPVCSCEWRAEPVQVLYWTVKCYRR